MIVPIILQPIPSQLTNFVLGTKYRCSIRFYERLGKLFADITINGNLIVNGQICRDRVGIIQPDYLKPNGNFYFADTVALDDPQYSGLGTRYKFYYVSNDETLPVGVVA